MPPVAKILLADEDSRVLIPLKAELWVHGYEVCTAASGREALEQIIKEKPQVAVCSLTLPDLGGLEVLRQARAQRPELVVILTSADIPLSQAVAAVRDGAYQLLAKPVDRARLARLIDDALRTADLRTLLGVYEASRAVFATVELDKLLAAVVKVTAGILKAEDVSIKLSEADGQAPQAREPALLVGGLGADARFCEISSLREASSSIVYPLAVGDETLGVLTINRAAGSEPFGLADVRTAAILAAQTAQAVRNARHYRDMRAKVEELDAANRKLEETQQMLLQTTKLASVGELASGLAHELNNPLTSVIGFAKYLLKADNHTSEQKGDVERIFKESKRCSEIVQNIRHFARLTPGEKQPVPLKALVETSLQLFRCSAPSVEIVPSFDDPELRVNADPTQLQQVLMQVLKNAKDAVEGRSDSRITVRVRPRGGKAAIEVTDNGCGIPAAILSKIFDPFFTTKPPGKGAGLGLSVSYGIMNQHDGSISVSSTEGQGTTVTAELPLLPPGAAS
jgi:signal transduction histidine kinase/DNA-binding response OmpR family regulator